MSYRWRIERLIAWSLFTLAGCLPWPVAKADAMDTLQVHGFLSQAWLVSDDNDFFGPSSENDGSFQYTEIGLNVSLRPLRDVLVSAQVLSRRAGDDDASPRLDHGIVDYQAFSNARRRLGIQLGRFKNPFGFYNQTRDVAFTRPSILLPQSIYFERTRSLALAADGVSVYDEEYLADGTLRLQIGIGDPQAGDDLDETLGLGEQAGSFDGRTSYIGQILYEDGEGHWTAALSAADVTARYQDSAGPIGDGRFHFQPWILSWQYNQEHWSLTTEFALRRIALDDFTNPRLNDVSLGQSWYVQYTRRFADEWQWLLRYDSLANDRNDRDGSQYEADGLGPAYSRYARDVTTGLQWRIHPRVLLAAEWHNIEGTGWLPVADAEDTEKYWNLLLFQASFRF
ncbi:MULTISPECIES: hypothetical protein [unclassified Modicisalibacter]|uniref:hypothetical protein n=1 Tax=unclassified Modicisalibacter TaxID=2679913 RepID=UPI001CCED16C|nr:MULTISPECIES: hypothetical protein [unclassified Modicisalibacter]